MSTKIEIVPFDANWKLCFQEAAVKLKETFGSLPIDFQHVGSTSIPDCFAKPVIDILGITSDITEIDSFNSSLANLGFQAKGEYGMKQRRYFQKKDIPCINLHIFEETDPEVMRHLRFCNYLRKSPQKVVEYSQLKRDLAKQFPNDIDSYCLGKEQFIKKIDMQAAKAVTTPNYTLAGAEKKQNWSDEEIKKAMDVNMHLLMIYFAKYVTALEIVFEPDVTVVRSEIADNYFNLVISPRFTKENAKERLQHIVSIFQEKKLPFSLELSPLDTPDNLKELLIESGFSIADDSYGMSLELDKWGKNSAHFLPDLEFFHVQNHATLHDFSKVIVATGESPRFFEDVLSKAPEVLYKDGAALEMYIAYADSIPVAAGIVLFHANVAGIYYLSTDPCHRKKGYGTAMMEQLLVRAKNKGYHLATLQATKEGHSIYKRLGFVDIATYTEFSHE